MSPKAVGTSPPARFDCHPLLQQIGYFATSSSHHSDSELCSDACGVRSLAESGRHAVVVVRIIVIDVAGVVHVKRVIRIITICRTQPPSGGAIQQVTVL